MALSKRDKQARDKYLEKIRLIRERTHQTGDASPEAKAKRVARAKVDPKFFIEYYFPHYATAECADFQIKAGKKNLKKKRWKAVLEWARGLAKSTNGDIFMPLQNWINDECWCHVTISANAQAAKVLLSDMQAEFEANQRFIADFGYQVVDGSWEEGNFRTRNGSAFFSRGRGQKLRGLKNGTHRVDSVTIDDIDDDETSKNPRRVRQYIEWVNTAVMGLGDVGCFRVRIVNNRIAKHTIMGHFADHPGWDHIKVNALNKKGEPSWWQKYTKEYYKELEATTNWVSFQTEYMNNPIVEGGIFKQEWFQFAKLPPWKDFDHVVGYWDIAFTGNSTSDFNAVNLEGVVGRNFWTIDCFVRQTEMKNAIRWMYEKDEVAKKKGVHIMWYCERQFWNAPVEEALREVAKEYGYEIHVIRDDRVKSNKLDRMISMSFYWQQYRKFYNSELKNTHDGKTMVAQTMAVEPGMKSNDDGPDCQEGSLSKLQVRTRSEDRLPVVGKRKRPNSY